VGETAPGFGRGRALRALLAGLAAAVGCLAATAGAIGKAGAATPSGSHSTGPARWLISRDAIRLIDTYLGNDTLTTSVFDTPTTVETGDPAAGWTSQKTVTFYAYGSSSTPHSFLYAIAKGLIPSGTTYVMYDDENWSMTPLDEQQDPAQYMADFVATAHDNGYQAIIAPSPDITTAMSCFDSAKPNWENYLGSCGIPALVAKANADIFEIQAQPYENVTGTGSNCGCYRWIVSDAVSEARAIDPQIGVVAGLSSDPEGQVTSGETLYTDTLHTQSLVSGYWLNLPQKGQECASCTSTGEPQVAAEYLTLREDGGKGSGGGGSSGSGKPAPAAYWLAASDGQVFAAGSAPSLGGLQVPASDPVVDIAATPDGRGYWIVTAGGTVRAFGDAAFRGDLPADGVRVSDIVAIAPTGDGHGYWLIGRDGGEFAFGDARYHGSLPGVGVHVHDVVGMVATSDGGGYWLVGVDGGVFAFGDAHYKGSLPALGVHATNVRAMIAAPSRDGYMLVGSDGGTFAFGSGVRYLGSLPSRGIVVEDIAGLALTPGAGGYWLAGANGAVYSFGNAENLATPAGVSANLPIAAIAAA
jgi:hypothetical protein